MPDGTKENDPAPQEVLESVFGDTVPHLVDHLVDQRQAVFGRKIFWLHKGGFKRNTGAAPCRSGKAVIYIHQAIAPPVAFPSWDAARWQA